MKTVITPLFIVVFAFVSLSGRAADQALTAQEQGWLQKAHRQDKNGWIYLHLEGAPRERGFQHGYLLAKEIEQGIKATKTTWEYQTSMDWGWLVKKSAALFTTKIDKENLAELDGIVEGLKAAGVSSSEPELIAHNAYFELIWNWWPQEIKKIKEGPAAGAKQACSAFIATGSMTTDGGIVLGHSLHMDYTLPLPNIIVDILPAKGHRILMQTYPGYIYSWTDFFVTDAGLVGAETAIVYFEGFDPRGIPEFSRMRRATQDAATIEEWCAIMKKGNNGGNANSWLLGDINTGEIARLELGLKNVSLERKSDGYFTGSNIVENLKILRLETNAKETDIRESNISRKIRWRQLMAESVGKIDLEMAKRFLADHYDTFLKKERVGGRGLCPHNEYQRTPTWGFSAPYQPGGSLDGKVMDTKMAKKMSFAARWGSACGRAFDAKKFLEDHPQFEWMKEILPSRSSQPWTEFSAGEKH